ncbi:hypothetical protein PENARI_c005G01303 [Penicillium arizonense]|uniref:RTA1 like protein n=1 Tax=Penicillium arizonense TaxID=1835702 RepID=A0A1F5LNJ1_PENAI|nr:hypothetical protein PENARI_c005G01303 [Penicillium arizonense]OGE54784.1 hypothetical protein PENARI_c005G01303 [Penicillium arizonense]
MSENNIYGYNPSLPAAIIFIILFGASTAYHGYQLVKSRCMYFIPFLIGGVFQIIGYICRAASHDNYSGISLYAIQTLLILLAPPLYAASIYMVLGRTVTYLHAEHLSLVPVKWMTKIFVTGDVFSFLLQCAGGGLMSAGSSMHETGSNVTVGGLVIQLLFFGFFVVVTTVFHFRISRHPTSKSQTELGITRSQGWKQRNWSTILIGLYIVSVLILVRSVFRLVEYREGYSGYIMTHEVFMYIFDGLLMWIAMIVMNIYHPAEILGNGKGGQGEYTETMQL